MDKSFFPGVIHLSGCECRSRSGPCGVGRDIGVGEGEWGISFQYRGWDN